MATKAQRFFALGGALLFFITASFLTIAFIIANIESSHNSSKTTNSSTASTKSDTATTSKTASQTATSKTSSTKLQGTKMENFTPVASVTQLQSTDLTPGTGAVAADGDTLVVDYTGAVAATGVIFQSSLDSGQTFSFKLGAGQVITGWDQGLVGMKVGGTRRLLIPANMAYGSTPPSGAGIPANAALVFDITLHSISTN